MRLPAVLAALASLALVAGCTEPAPLAPGNDTVASGAPPDPAASPGPTAGGWSVQLMRPGDEPAFLAHGDNFTVHGQTTVQREDATLRALWDGALPAGSYTVVVAAQPVEAADGAPSLNATLTMGGATARCPGGDTAHVTVFVGKPGECTFRVAVPAEQADAAGWELDVRADPSLLPHGTELSFDARTSGA